VWEGGVCELFVGGGSTSATSVLLRRRYPLTVRGYLFALRVGGLAVAGPCPTSTLIRSYPGEPGRSLSATCDPFGSLQLGTLRAISLALWPKPQDIVGKESSSALSSRVKFVGMQPSPEAIAIR